MTEELIRKLEELRLFLNGEGELGGLSFGEVPPPSETKFNRHWPGSYWWRKHMSALLLQAAEALSAAPVQAVDREEGSSRSQPSGRASADAEVSAGLNAEPSGAFTPGPWFIAHRDGTDIHVCAPDDGSVDDPWNIALVVGACGYPNDPRTGCTEGNARLIAAAPDLYAAMSDMLAGWRYIRKHHGDLYGVGWDRAEKAATAALAKAHPPATEKTEGGEG
jgi:hypothetical protein